ncbi:MAG: CBS domain-containing protein, partial [Candidatus Thiodiazotropha taylori]
MKNDFDLVEGMDTVESALEKMSHVETKSLIVKKRDENDEFGIVTLSDIARQVLAKDRAPERVNIYEIMSKPAFTVSADM